MTANEITRIENGGSKRFQLLAGSRLGILQSPAGGLAVGNRKEPGFQEGKGRV